MELRRLGASELKLTPLGLGTGAAGGANWEFAWGPQSDQETIDAIQRALDLGINWIDTAAVYGLGHSEEVVGRAIHQRPKKPYIFTKCSMRWDTARQIKRSLRAVSVRGECEDSLRRLGIETIDLYQIHWPSPNPEIEEGWETLAKLQAEGKVRYIGVSNFNADELERVRAIAPVTSLQPPYSLVQPAAETDLFPYCRRHDIGVIVHSPMQAGLLTGSMTRERVRAFAREDWRRRSADFQEPRLTQHLKVQEKLGEIGARHGHSAAVVALAWALRHEAVTGAIVGARRPAQVEGFIAAQTFRLSPAELQEIASTIARQAEPLRSAGN